MTFVFTDIEGSTRRWELAPDAMADDLAVHDELVAELVEEHGGIVLKHLGDGFATVFSAAPAALEAAIAIDRELRDTSWRASDRLRVRMGMHSGVAEPFDGDYYGPTINRAARVGEVANGDQIVCSRATAALCPGGGFRDAGVHQLRGVGAERLFVAAVEGSDAADRALRTDDYGESNLPHALTEMIGRDRDMEELPGQVRDHRLVTLVGPGGVGKTRLAVGVAAGMRADFPGGVRYCELAPVADVDAVAVAVAAGVGARQQTGLGLVESIAAYIERQPTLIVLDNCEHVLDEVNRVVAGLLDVEGATVLATSREPIGIAGEQIRPVRALDPATTAIQLFVERARERDPYFEADGDDEEPVAEICRRLDGIPLAVELAAARVGHLTPAEIAGRLDDRFRLLRGAHRSGRHQTLLETVEWSYDMLEPAEAALFARLSVFAGDFTLDAAHAICGAGEMDALDVLDLLAALVDKSMVDLGKVDGESRYAILETLRQFGAERLDASDDAAAVRTRHARYHRDLARRENARLHTADERAAWAALAADWDNLRAAFEYASGSGDVDTAVELVLSLYWYSTYSMRDEAFTWAREALRWPGIEEHADYGSLCGAAATGAYFAADVDARPIAVRGLAADPTDPRGFGHLVLAAEFLNNLLDREASAAVMSRWASIVDPGDLPSRLWVSGMSAFHHSSLDPSPAGAEHAAETMRLALECGSPTALALGHWATGLALMGTDQSAGAAALDAGVATALDVAPRHLLTHLIRGVLVHHRSRSDDIGEGLEECRGALVAALDDHYEVGTSHLLSVAAHLLLRSGDDELATRLIDTMIAHGHHPRGGRVGAIADARSAAAGTAMSIRDAATLAVEAISEIQTRSLVGLS